jgi:hypothetical protein
MTEAEWLACADAEPMLEFLRGKASDRKLRLFATACILSAWDILEHDDPHLTQCCRLAVETAERHGDALVGLDAMQKARGAVQAAARGSGADWPD